MFQTPGIRVLISANRALKNIEGGCLILSGLNKHTYNMLEALQLLDYFCICDDIPQAMQRMRNNECY